MNADWLDGIVSLIAGYGLRVIGALLLLIGGWIVSKWVRRSLWARFEKSELDQTLAKFFSNIAGTLILIFALFAALELFGVQTTSFIAVLGAAGLAVGLALQGTLSNFAAGVMLLIFRPFKVGDAVSVAGKTGIIQAIELFVTNMDTFDNRRIIIPNSMIFGDVIETISFHAIRRVDVSVGTEYPADLDRVRSILQTAAASIPETLDDPAPAVVLLRLGDSSIDWDVRVWTNTDVYGATKQALIRATKNALDEAGIGIPFPQMHVHMDGAVASHS